LDDEVVHRIWKVDDFDAQSDYLACAATTQTFDYMVDCKVRYGYLTNGETTIFLKIDANSGESLYHISQPTQEVQTHREEHKYYTAVSQAVSFCLISHKSPNLSQDEVRAVKEKVKRWKVHDDKIIKKLPQSELKPSPAHSEYLPSPGVGSVN
jgi:hypothetical protein